MKLISFANYDDYALAALAGGKPTAENQFAVIVANEIAAIVGNTTDVIEQYSTFFLGNILTDEGLDVAESETLSVNDDHDQATDLDYFYDRMKETGAQFGVFCWFENELLTILFFGE